MRRSRAEFDLHSLDAVHSARKVRIRSESFQSDGDRSGPLGRLTSDISAALPPASPPTTPSSSGIPVINMPSLAHQEICFFLFQTALAAAHVEVRSVY